MQQVFNLGEGRAVVINLSFLKLHLQCHPPASAESRDSSFDKLEKEKSCLTVFYRETANGASKWKLNILK